MKICKNCGTEVERTFCPDCGTKYEEEVTVEAEVVIEPETAVEPAATETTETSWEVMTLPRFEGEEAYQNQKTFDETLDGMSGKLSAKSTSIIAYITWIGLIIALIIGDKGSARFHVNQALVINLASFIIGLVGGIIPFLGALIVVAGGLFCTVCWGLGLYYAVTQQEKEVPLLGQIRLL